MKQGRPKLFELSLSETERAELLRLGKSRSLPYSLVRRAQIIILSADGRSNSDIAKKFNLSVPSVAYWRGRFKASGLAGLYGEERPGRPRTHDDDQIAGLLNTVLQSKPKHATHWSIRKVATCDCLELVDTDIRVKGKWIGRLRGQEP